MASIKSKIRRYIFTGSGPLLGAAKKLYILLSIAKSRAKKKFVDCERKMTYGELDPDKTYYVIRRAGEGAGFLSNFHHVMLHIIIARSRGLYPVVDMMNYKTCYNEDEPINGTMNPWEYFFRQPDDTDLARVYKSKNVILCDADYPWHVHQQYYTNMGEDKWISELHDVITREIRFNALTQAYLDDAWRSIAPTDGKILAVMSRGTDYRDTKPKGHNIQPEPAYLLTRARELMREHDLKYVFLSTEERFVADMFRAEFGDALLHFDEREYFDDMDNDMLITEYRHSRAHPLYNIILEYLRNVIIASRCDCLLCGINNGSLAAMEYNGGKYIARDVYDVGVYE